MKANKVNTKQIDKQYVPDLVLYYAAIRKFD